jgi:hypothetical protein
MSARIADTSFLLRSCKANDISTAIVEPVCVTVDCEMDEGYHKPGCMLPHPHTMHACVGSEMIITERRSVDVDYHGETWFGKEGRTSIPIGIWH